MSLDIMGKGANTRRMILKHYEGHKRLRINHILNLLAEMKVLGHGASGEQ